MIGIYLAILLIPILFKVWWDTKAKNEGRVINHTLSAAIDVFIYFFIALVLTSNNILSIGLLFLGLLFRWNLFDILWNIVNKMPWNYLGESSVMDKFGKKIGNNIYYAVKFVLLIITIIIII